MMLSDLQTRVAARARSVQHGFRVWSARFAHNVPFSALAEGRRVRIDGRVERFESETRSLFTQQPSVLHVDAVRIKHHRYDPNGMHYIAWETPPPRCSEQPFWLVDDGGQRVLVDPKHAVFRLPMRDVSNLAHVNDDNPEIHRLLAGYGVVPTLYMGLSEDVIFLEALVAHGDRLAIVGIPSMAPVHMTGGEGGYRDHSVAVPHFAGTREWPLVIMQAAAPR